MEENVNWNIAWILCRLMTIMTIMHVQLRFYKVNKMMMYDDNDYNDVDDDDHDDVVMVEGMEVVGSNVNLHMVGPGHNTH